MTLTNIVPALFLRCSYVVPRCTFRAVQKVLVVEDDDLIASSLVRALTAKGYAADSARSLAEAEIKKDCDLILCDLTLPDGDGLDFISRMSLVCPHIPVIALTA